MHLYYKKLLTYYSILQCVCFLKSENNFYQTSNSGAKNLMLHDMMMAFRPIANSNSTNYIENMVTHMYNFHKTKSAMIFKLPQNSENLQLLQPPDTPSHRVIFMERQQFIQPTFPNLTKSYMILRRFKFSKRPINANITQLMIKEMQEINRESLYDEWSHLGLNGWNGDIAGSSSSPEQQLNNNKLIAPTINDYPVHEITKDLTQFDPNNSVYLQEIAANALMEKNDLAAMRQELDNNIYIARANDPFGYSTKWQMIKSNQTKSKRGVLQLYSMVKCSTNCDPLGYKGYGCYCGFLGHGRPTDGIDRCCKIHDKCYENTNCIWGLEYFAPYVWKCYRGKPTCAIDHGEWGGPDSCAASLCRCDLSLSRCLRQYACPKRRAVCRSSISRRLENILLQ